MLVTVWLRLFEDGSTESQIGDVRHRARARTRRSRTLRFLDKAAAYEEFQRIFRKDPDLVKNVDAEALPTSYRIIPEEAEFTNQIKRRFEPLAGVDDVAFFGAGGARTRRPRTRSCRGWPTWGLGYLRLGQPLTTLSGGERQRLKLATHMSEEGGVYVLDESTTGLHLADLQQLLLLLDRLVDSGKSVIVIEHHQAVMAHADWIIDLGPGAGHDGGRVVFEGTPADLVAARSTLTGEHLAAFVSHNGRRSKRYS